MTTQLDFSVGIGKETTYGETVTPTRFFEAEAAMKYNIQRAEGRGLRPTKAVNRLSRSSISRHEVSGDQQVEALTSGLGFLLNAALGAVTNTVVPSTTPPVYQQVHTITKTDPVTSYTIQEVLPFLGGTGQEAYVFAGCVANTLDIEVAEGAAVDVKIGWLGKSFATTGSPAAASYPANDSLITFVHGEIKVGGAITPPTATAVGSSTAIASANIKQVSLSISNGLDSDGYNLGGGGERSRVNALGKRSISGKVTAEFDSATLRAAYTDQTPLALVLDFVHDTQIGVATPGDVPQYAQLQIVIPSLLLKGEIPSSNGGSVITQSIDFEAYDNGTAAEPVWVVYRTLDTTP